MRSAIIFPFLLPFSLSAQIIYTDVVPDQTYYATGDSLYLDLDNNAVVDFKVSLVRPTGPSCNGNCAGQHSTVSYMRVRPMGTNEVIDSTGSYPTMLASGDLVGSTLPWSNAISQTLSARTGTTCINFGGMWTCIATTPSGKWGPGNVTGFLGLRFTSGGSLHYGWVRLSITQGSSSIAHFVVMDYAYNSVANTSLLAGATGATDPPPAPVLISPADIGADINPTSTSFSWNAVGGATAYELQRATDAGFSAGVANYPGLAGTSTTVNDLAYGQVYYWHMRSSNGNGNGPWSPTWSFYTRTLETTMTLKVFLQGPLDANTLLMSDGLRAAGLIPTTEPYTALGYSLANPGATVSAAQLSVTGNDAIVDWILVQLRHGTTNAVLRSYAMYVKRNGNVSLSGSTPQLVFPMSLSKVAVLHRNHLGVMSAALNVTGSPFTLDLTQTSTILFGTEPTATVNTTRRALWAGEVLGDGLIKYTGVNNDRDPILTAVGSTTPNNTVAGYARTDITLDGVIKYTGTNNDRDRILVTVGGLPNSTRAEQLP